MSWSELICVVFAGVFTLVVVVSLVVFVVRIFREARPQERKRGGGAGAEPYDEKRPRYKTRERKSR